MVNIKINILMLHSWVLSAIKSWHTDIIRYLFIHNVHTQYPSVGISRPKLNRTLYHTAQMSGYCTLYNFSVLSYNLNTVCTSYLIHFDMALLTLYTNMYQFTIYMWLLAVCAVYVYEVRSSLKMAINCVRNATKCYFDRWDNLKEKASFNPFPGNTE